MADVFLSYARRDREVAERLAYAIEQAGLTVWWDRHIKGGSEFSCDIERQLEAAAHVVVLWSKYAVTSRWVRDEASVAADRGRLISATIDGTPPPLGFRQFQTIDLARWATDGDVLPAVLAETLEVEPPPTSESTVGAARPTRRRGIIAAAIAALLLAGAATVAVVQPPPFSRLFAGETQTGEVSLAIMPFQTEGGSSNDYLGPGLSSALADSLAPLSGLKITASTSSQAVARQGLTAPDIAEKLGITHLVEGNVQQNGKGFSITVRLIDARNSEQIWTRSFEGKAEELQRLKSRMARELAGGLIARLGVGRGQLADRRDIDPAAYEAYLRALERLSVRDNVEARREALKQFRLAASIQPDFADAHAGYAYLVALSAPFQLGISWREAMAEHRRAGARALELDPNNALALVAQATALQKFNGEIERPIAILQSVLSESPNFVPAHYSLAVAFFMAGRARLALDHLEQAIGRDPFDNVMRFHRARVLYSLGDYDAVRDEALKSGGRLWFLAMIGFASPEDYRRDFPALIEQASAEGVSREEQARMRGIAEALILGRSYTLPEWEDDEASFPAAGIAARLIGFEEALRYARMAANDLQPDKVLDILNEGRATFTSEQRADPRYHELFRHPKLVKISSARGREGVTAGLPVFPIKQYTGR